MQKYKTKIGISSMLVEAPICWTAVPPWLLSGAEVDLRVMGKLRDYENPKE